MNFFVGVQGQRLPFVITDAKMVELSYLVQAVMGSNLYDVGVKISKLIWIRWNKWNKCGRYKTTNTIWQNSKSQ